MTESKFEFLGGKYILYKGKHEYTVFGENMGQPIFSELLDAEKADGDEFAFKQLELLERTGPCAAAIRRANEHDPHHVALLKSTNQKLALGDCYECEACPKTFFDMGRPDAKCPGCAKPTSECKKK